MRNADQGRWQLRRSGDPPVTPSDWLVQNLPDVIVAVSQAGATLAGSTVDANVSQSNTDVQVPRDE